MRYQNLTHSVITALNGRLRNWSCQTSKRLHQELPRKDGSFGGKALWKPPYRGSGSLTGEPGLWGVFRRYHRRLFVACDGRSATFPPTLTDYTFHLFIYRLWCCSIELLREEFQPVHGADKNSEYKHAPIRELAANQPLPQRDLRYLQSGRALRPSDSLLGPRQRTLR